MNVRIIFLFLFCLPHLFGSVIITDTTKIPSDFSLSYLYDEHSTLTVKEVATTPFPQTIPSQFALGYKEGAAWFRLSVENKSDNSDYILYFTEPFWASFDLYEPVKDGWKVHKNGLLTPIKNREIEDANPAFSVKIPQNTTKTFYIRGQTINAQIGAFKLYTETEFVRPSRLALNTFYLFYSGVLFIIIVLNLFLFIAMRERIYAYYIGYVSAFVMFVSMFNGAYLYLGFAPWNEGLHVVGTVVLAFMALFSGTFLELKKYFPRMAQVFKLFTMVFFIFGLLIHFDIHYATLIFNILSSIFIFILLIIAVKTWLLGKIKTRYYLIALIVYMPTMALMVLTFNGLLDNTDFTRYAFLVGALIEIIFFSLILANRFHAAKDEKIHFQKELLAEKQKNQELLEHEITLQRQEIQEKNAILFHQSRHAAMGEMISLIAHQWRQPLNTLALINQDLYFKYKFNKCDEDTFEQSHHQFNEHLQYMSKTIDDFRNYYKNDGTQQPEDIGEIAKLALSLSEVFLNYAQITAELDVKAHQRVNLAKNEMIQVLMNLIKNSHDAIVEQKIPNGKIIITIEDIGTNVQILVSDNAGGISNQIEAKIFEPYFSTKSDNGTGLGLYMCKTIIEEHCKGTITFHNANEGVCFTITLPAIT